MKSLDILSPSPSFYFDSSSRYKSLFGSFMSALTAGIFICLTVFFGLDLARRESPEVSFSKTLNNNPAVSSDELFMALSMHYGGGRDIVEMERKLEYKITFIQTDTERDDVISNSTSLPMKPCSETKIFKENKGNILSNLLVSEASYYCPPDEFDYKIFGRFGYPSFSLVRYEVKYCSSRPDCYSPEFIAKNLTNIYYQGVFKDSYVDSFDFENPVKDNFSQILLQVSSHFKQSINVFFQELYFFGDENWIFAGEVNFKSHIFDSYSFSLSDLEDDKTIVKVIVAFNDFEQQYKRKYIKVQDVLAQVVGLTKMFTIAFKIILEIYSFFSLTKHRLHQYYDNSALINPFLSETNNQTEIEVNPTRARKSDKTTFIKKISFMRRFNSVFKSILSEDNLFELCALHEANKSQRNRESKKIMKNLLKAKMNKKT